MYKNFKEKLQILLDKIEYRGSEVDYPNCFGWVDGDYEKELFDFINHIKGKVDDVTFELIIFIILERAKFLLKK